ncbi:MAG TPA: aminoacyl-tRNA hydrolase [Candidatus Saccharimonadales bacterium]|nr:aminoacyl-tRNA hydrolase [Candidatus Saccharimonadales bacterium]
MGWLQKRPQVSENIQFYTVGQNKTVLLVGLGNPGTEYELTRHNIGFQCLDKFAQQSDGFDQWVDKKDLSCLQTTGRVGENRVIAIKPTTFMNLSGEAVQRAAAYYKIATQNILVVHDELDIDFGHIRTRTGGSSAGHNGIKSITHHMGESYGRIRIGIGPKNPPEIDSADFVLQKFTTDEQSQLPNLFREVNAVLTEYLFGGTLPTDTRQFII